MDGAICSRCRPTSCGSWGYPSFPAYAADVAEFFGQFERLKALVPPRFMQPTQHFLDETDAVLGQYLRGQLMVMGLLAVFYTVGLALAGLQLALPIGVFTGLAVFVPYLGYGLGLVLGLIFARHALHAALRQGRIWARERLAELVRVNGDIMIRSVLLQGAFTSFMFLGAGQGDVTLAANQVLLQFLEIVAYGLDGFAFAAESLVGQAIGARRPDRLARAARLTSQWGVAGAALLGGVFWLAGPAIIDLLTTSPEVREMARHYLPWLIVAPLIGIASWMLDGIFIGATRTREMRNAMLVSVAVYAVLVSVLPMVMGNHGLWAALMGLNALRGLTMWRLYPRVVQAAR